MGKRSWRRCAAALCALAFMIHVFVACESIDCTLNNVVTCNYAFYASGTGSLQPVTDTLTVTAEGTDSVLFNRGIGISSLALPMSHWQEADTLHFTFRNSDGETTHNVRLIVEKSNMPHFESPDCPTTMFHELKAVNFDSPTHYVDSVVVAHTSVNYGIQENIKIYLHADD